MSCPFCGMEHTSTACPGSHFVPIAQVAPMNNPGWQCPKCGATNAPWVARCCGPSIRLDYSSDSIPLPSVPAERDAERPQQITRRCGCVFELLENCDGGLDIHRAACPAHPTAPWVWPRIEGAYLVEQSPKGEG